MNILSLGSVTYMTTEDRLNGVTKHLLAPDHSSNEYMRDSKSLPADICR